MGHFAMKISLQRIAEVFRAFVNFRRELEIFHSQGEGKNGCIGWPECDCRLAEQIRGIVHIETEWEYRLINLRSDDVTTRAYETPDGL